MGSSTSKAVKSATQTAVTTTTRKYPTRSPPLSSPRTYNAPPPPATTGPTVYPPPQATESRTQAIETDGQDSTLDAPNPGLSARLQELGPVQPNPTLSNSSTFNFQTRQPLQNPANPTPSRSQTSSPQSQQSSSDPSLSGQFIPSASNPQQSIFPSQSHPQAGGRPNSALSLLTARYRLAEEAEREFANLGKASAGGRQFLDVITIRKVLEMRDEKGLQEGEIESRLDLGKGVVGRLGRGGVVGVAQ